MPPIVKKTSINKEFEDTIISLHYKLVGKFHQEAKKKGFTASQLEVMRYVGCEGNPTMKEIAEHLSIKPPSVTTIIDTLCKKQFLKREFDKSDKRVARIILAPKFYKFFSSFKEKKLDIVKDFFSTLDDKEKKEISIIIRKLLKE